MVRPTGCDLSTVYRSRLGRLALKPMYEQVMVITGASSGIGLATAQEAARHGAKVVLASRNEEALASAARKIRDCGGQAEYVVGDVGRREDIARIADVATRHFGRIDTWVNNAGASVWGRMQDGDEDDHRRLFDTNFWGVVYGSMEAVRRLRESGGAIINVGSVASEMAYPNLGMYSASKHAVMGFTDALRLELEEEGLAISVTLIKPTSTDTPFARHSKNLTGREPRLPPPIYRPQEVANAILHAACRPRRDVYVGGAGRMMTALGRVAPRTFDWYRERLLPRQQFRDEPPKNRQGSLHHPGKDGRIRGDHDGYVMKTSLYTRAVLHPVLTCMALTGLAAVIAAAVAKPNVGKRSW